MSEMQNCRDYLLNAVSSNETLFAFPAGLLNPLGADFPFIYVNHRMVQLAGIPQEQFIDRSFHSWFGARTDTETRLQVRLGIEGDRYTEADLLCYRRGGASFWNRITLTPIRDENGRTSLFLVSAQDITRIRRLEDALLQPSQLTDRTTRSMQLVIEKTQARFHAVRQFQSVLVAHLERGWRRHSARLRGAQLANGRTEPVELPVFVERRQSALMGGAKRRRTVVAPGAAGAYS